MLIDKQALIITTHPRKWRLPMGPRSIPSRLGEALEYAGARGFVRHLLLHVACGLQVGEQ
jgi:hypothetical protein